MNFSGSKDFPVPRFSGKCDFDAATKYPMGIGVVVKNIRFLMESVGCRFGLKETMQDGASPVTGLGILNFIGGSSPIIPTRFDTSGVLKKESPSGSKTLVSITSNLVSLPTGAYEQNAVAYNKMWKAYSDLKTQKGYGAVYDGATGSLDPISSRQVGQPWEANSTYNLGEIVSPSVSNGHLYRTTKGTTTITEPTWPTTTGGTVVQDGITYTEITPIATTTLISPNAVLTRVAGAGTFAVNKDVYVKLTFVSPQGETDIVTATASKIVNTVLNDRVQVASPAAPAWVSALDVSYQPTQYKVYESTVTTGALAPDDSTYKLSATTALGSPTNVDAAAAGAVGPTANSAWVTPAGNICAGLRYMVVLMETRTNYIAGFDAAAVIPVMVPSAGRQLLVANVYTGSENIKSRICGFGVPGDSPAGRFFYIANKDFTGINITSTVIPDNTSTSIVVNFDDQYLATSSATDISDFYLKMRVPPCVDIYYSKATDRLVYTGAIGYESGHLVSERADPETVIGGKGVVQVAENNGERCVCYRELPLGEQLSFKDGSVHVINASTDVSTPAVWGSNPKFDKAGACGPRAVDTGADKNSNFAIFAHETGVWKYENGNFDQVSDEIINSWQGINWAYKHLIWVHIDVERKEVRVGVPYGTSTICNKMFTLNYFMGWDQAVVVSMFNKMIVSHNCRKWSGPDDIAATMAITAKRDLTVSVDPRIDHRQILLASALNDGRVNMIVPDSYDDNGVGIDQQFQPAYAQEESLALLSFRGANVAAKGKGKLFYRPVTDDPKELLRGNFEILNPARISNFAAGANGEDEYFSFLFTNGKVAGNYFELSELVLKAVPKWGSRQG